jgi:hypothetical protein
MARKTCYVRDLIEEVNRRNSVSTCPPDVRSGWNSLLDGVLHETGNYRGYTYLEARHVPVGQAPGVLRTETGNVFPDESRRNYIMPIR